MEKTRVKATDPLPKDISGQIIENMKREGRFKTYAALNKDLGKHPSFAHLVKRKLLNLNESLLIYFAIKHNIPLDKLIPSDEPLLLEKMEKKLKKEGDQIIKTHKIKKENDKTNIDETNIITMDEPEKIMAGLYILLNVVDYDGICLKLDTTIHKIIEFKNSGKFPIEWFKKIIDSEGGLDFLQRWGINKDSPFDLIKKKSEDKVEESSEQDAASQSDITGDEKISKDSVIIPIKKKKEEKIVEPPATINEDCLPPDIVKAIYQAGRKIEKNKNPSGDSSIIEMFLGILCSNLSNWNINFSNSEITFQKLGEDQKVLFKIPENFFQD